MSEVSYWISIQKMYVFFFFFLVDYDPGLCRKFSFKILFYNRIREADMTHVSFQTKGHKITEFGPGTTPVPSLDRFPNCLTLIQFLSNKS